MHQSTLEKILIKKEYEKYDEKNFELIVDTLMSKDFEKIHAINRAQLIDDALTLAWSKDQSYSLSMNLMEYLVQEEEYIPWLAALDNLSNIYRIIRHSPQMEDFKVGLGLKINQIWFYNFQIFSEIYA